MLNKYPTLPIKGKKNATKNRVAVDGRKVEVKRRLELVKKALPYHYYKTGGRHYLSLEVANATIQELEDYACGDTTIGLNQLVEQKEKIKQMIDKL